jgi:hypothetical protein
LVTGTGLAVRAGSEVNVVVGSETTGTARLRLARAKAIRLEYVKELWPTMVGESLGMMCVVIR